MLKPMPEVAPLGPILNRKRSEAARLRRSSRSQNSSNPSSQAAHSSLDAFLNSRPSGNFFGDNSNAHDSRSTRILFQNVHGIPLKMGEEKQRGLFQCWKDERVGISLLAEMNLNWNAVPLGQRWYDRVRQGGVKRGHYSSVAYNALQEIPSKSAFQWGGCSATLLNQVSHASRSAGVDPTGLGRWAWVKVRGRAQLASNDRAEESADSIARDLVVISAYRPNKPSQSTGSVWNRQRNFWLGRDLDVDPREKFTSDLVDDIAKWRSEGCEVILGIDANEDVSSNHPGSFRQHMRSSGLSEAILSRHHGPYPATQQSNQSNTPIDGIFVSPGVELLSSGYLDFHQYFQSDHRGIWIDIDLWKTLGRSKPTKSFPVRRLNTIDGRCIKRYLRSAEEGYQEFDIPHRLSRLAEDFNVQGGVLTSVQQNSFDLIHSQAYMIRRKAEKNCRKVRKGGVPWSPLMQKKWDRLRLLDLLIKGHLGLRTSSRKIRRLLKKTKLPDLWKSPLELLQRQLEEEWKKYKALKATRAQTFRTNHITVRSTAPARASSRLSKRRIRISRSQRMAQKEETRRRRKAQGKGFSGGLKQIQVLASASSASESWVTCTSRKLVEEGCMRENQARYDQTRFPFPTPPMTEPLYSMFNGPSAESNSRALLRGNLEPPSDDPVLRSFINNCRRPEKLSELPLSVTLEDHVHFWSRMKEEKGSEPHGLHNGHFKAGATSPLLSHCDMLIRAFPFSSGFVPAQWRHLMNFAIEKKPGEIRVTKMRTIQMMNSEFQANNKKVGKEAMAYAERNDLIPKGQCGARKAHQAIDLALSKRLTWDLLILQRRAAGFVSNDAKSCFDRIVHWVAIISLMRFGIQWQPLRCMFDTLMQSAHRVRTGFGDSSRIFRPPSDIPYQGCGQGNGAGPTIWVAVSSILLGMMISQGFGFESLAALSGIAVIANCFAFIDDTDICQAAPSVDQSGEATMPSVQHSLDWWSQAIRLSGGALSPAKSFWWLIDFKWDPTRGKWAFRRRRDFFEDGIVDESGIELRTPDLDGSTVTLPWLEPDQSERTLGVMMAPQSNPSAQLDLLKTKAQDWANTVRSSLLLPHDALPLLKTTIMKTLEYPMALTTFSAAEWEEVLSPVLMSILPKAGICRTFPRAVVYAPFRFQGLGIPHPFGVQMGKHLDMLLRHSANSTSTGVFLQATLQAHQLETGTSFGIFQQEYCNTAILTSDTWVKRVWKLLDEHRIHVEFDSPPLSLRREGDALLMDLFIDAEVDQDILLWLNWCRQHLHAVTLSDIVTADGTQISEAAWTGQRDCHQLDRYSWPRTCRPAPKWWDVWRYWLSVVVTGSTAGRSLLHPLGPWFQDDGRWRWKYSPVQHRLFHLHGGGWVEARRTSRLRGRNFRLPTTPARSCPFVPTLPLDCLLASVSRKHGSSEVTFLRCGRIDTSVPQSPSSILDLWHLDRLAITGAHGWAPDRVHIDGDESAVVDSFVQGTLRIVCDGSYKDGLGTACTQLIASDGVNKIWIYCQTPGMRRDQSSTRSELAGILSSIMALDWMSRLRALHRSRVRPTVELGCDGLIALRKSFGHKQLQPSSAQFDMASTIRSMLRKSPFLVQGRHVKGHADRRRPLSQLTWWELRNQEVDRRAQGFRESLESIGSPAAVNPRFFAEPSALFIHGEKASSLSVPSLLTLLAIPSLHTYWRKQTTPRLTPSQFEEIDWDVMERAMKALPANLQRWTAKHTVGMCGVGKFRLKWKYDTVGACPRCTTCKLEDHRHVIRCDSASASAEWDLRFSALRVWMEANHTAPEISAALSIFLKAIRDPTTVLDIDRIQSFHPSLLRRAICSQSVIGSQGLIEGLLSVHWRPLQQRHFDRVSSARSTSLWASRLIQQLLLLGHHMWIHRNSIQHSETNTRYLGRHREVDRGIREQYSMGKRDAPPRVRSMLAVPIRNVLGRPLDDRIEWLSLASRERTLYRRSLVRQRRMIYELRSRRSPSSARPLGTST